MSNEDEVLCVSKARVTGIEFTFEGDDPGNIAKERRKKARLKAKRKSLLDFFSVRPEDETQIMEAALDAYRKRSPVEVYQDARGRIVKIQPTDKI